MAWNLKGKVTKNDHREYGHAALEVVKTGFDSKDALFESLGESMTVRHSIVHCEINCLM